jgi:hypothetical protein
MEPDSIDVLDTENDRQVHRLTDLTISAMEPDKAICYLS